MLEKASVYHCCPEWMLWYRTCVYDSGATKLVLSLFSRKLPTFHTYQWTIICFDYVASTYLFTLRLMLNPFLAISFSSVRFALWQTKSFTPEAGVLGTDVLGRYEMKHPSVYCLSAARTQVRLRVDDRDGCWRHTRAVPSCARRSRVRRCVRKRRLSASFAALPQ